jgi:hypothetical protein
MADYYPLLSKAVAALAPNTPEARHSVYDRARAALNRQLSAIEPPVAPAIAEREMAALAAVIRRIEAEQGGGAVPSPEPDLPAAKAPPSPSRAPDPPRPTRPQVVRRDARPVRKPWIAAAAAVALMVVIAVATMAFLRRNDPPAVANRPSPTRQAAAPAVPAPRPDAKPEGKTEDRVTPGSAAETPARPAQQPPARPAEPRAAEAPVRPAEAPTTVSPPPTVAAPVAVANRMVLVLEGKEEPQKVEVRYGSVVWRTEMVSGGQGQTLQLAIRATIDVPDARLRAEITIQRNRDPAFPASHTLQVQFSSLSGSEIGPIQNLSQIEFRQSENQAGYALAGQGIAVMQDLFLVALAQIEPAQSRNVEMMRTRPLIYLEFQSTAGRRGAMIIEKGVTGQQAFDEAIRAWQ